ncbi:MAG: glycosyltransferase family 39 protein [Verrucomicrobiales bacterium]
MGPTNFRARNHRAAIVAGGVALLVAGILIANSDARTAWAEAAASVEGAGKIRVEPMAATCLWWSGVAVAVVAALASASAGLFSKLDQPGWIGPSELPGLLEHPPAHPRWFWPAILLTLLLGLGLRLPRMGHSLYNDESHNYVRIIAGEWKNCGEKGEKFRQPRWAETAFRNSTGNNGFLYSILARVGHDTWKKAAGAPDGMVKEWPTRVPPLLAGLATILLAGLVGARMGSPSAGFAMALLLAIHPWHVRYSTEARGYSIMIMAIMAGYVFLLAALQSGRWSAWVGHGMCQLVAMWANPGSLIAVALGQGGIFLMLAGWRIIGGRREAVHHLTRWAGGGLLAALAAGLVLTPGMIQLREQLQSNPAMVGTIPPGWWRDTLFFLGNGCGWGLADWENPVNPGAVHSPLRTAGAIAFYLLAGWGCWVAWKKSTVGKVVLVLALLHFFSLVPLYLRSVLSANVLLWWYALPALPGMIVLAGLGLGGARGRGRWLAGAVACVFAISSVSAILVFWKHGKSDGRELVRLARGGDFPNFDKEVVTLDLWSDAVTYDPLVRWADSLEQVREAGAKADGEGKKLFLYVGHESKARSTHPEVLDFVEHGGRFELAYTAWALESPVHDNRIYRWIPESKSPEK